ncbi:MAG: hypothetical protein KAH22_00750 [Thiotrichaceae bacterium]|nr:hypothetical protein [Thiotrichaceae bacterium]
MNIEEKKEDEGGLVCVPNKNGEEIYLYSLLPKDFINENGLLDVAVVGRFLDNKRDNQGSLVVDSFQGNPEFVHLFHQMLDGLGRHSEAVLKKLPEHEEGTWVYFIDQRVNDVDGDVEPKDIIGGYKVEDGKLGEYAGNPSHVLLTEEGIFQIGVKLKSELIELIKSKYKPN